MHIYDYITNTGINLVTITTLIATWYFWRGQEVSDIGRDIGRLWLDCSA